LPATYQTSHKFPQAHPGNLPTCDLGCPSKRFRPAALRDQRGGGTRWSGQGPRETSNSAGFKTRTKILLIRATQSTSRAETRHRLLTITRTVLESLGALGCRVYSAVYTVLEQQIMLGSCRKLSRIPQPGPQTTSCWCSIHQHNFLAVFPVSGAQV
jgi:hypothetical protein